MGGKKNQAQRTKNNVKPSSSSRSADLLGKDASKVVGFISFNQNVFAGKAQLLAADDLESIDPNFHVSLKKLSKKDAITKQKGLQELTEQFHSAEDGQSESIKSVLRLWSQVYCSLALDNDNKVREYTQTTHRALAARVGRSLAPCLKQIAHIWYVSQFDTYPPAASVASASLRETFPDNKMKELLCFCHEEIFNFIHHNVTDGTARGVSKPETKSEEWESKKERLLVSCLNAHAHFVEALSTSHLSHQLTVDKLSQLDTTLLSCHSYWNLSKHKTSLVRSAWYGSVISLCKNREELMKEWVDRLAQCVLANLDEPDPTVAAQVWEASLYSLNIINSKDGGEKVKDSIEKMIVEKVCRVLEKGGLGNASTIFPNLLPLVTALPAPLRCEDTLFYSSLFTSLRAGLKEPGVRVSVSESEVVVNTLMECFRYIVMLNNQRLQFCLDLLRQQLIELLSQVVKEPVYRLCARFVYRCTADLLVYWRRNSSTTPNFAVYADTLWESLRSDLVRSLSESCLDPVLLSHVLYCHRTFLETFLSPSSTRNKKSLKVKFESEEESIRVSESNCQLDMDKETERDLKTVGKELVKAYYSYTVDEEVSQELRHTCISQLSHVVKSLGFDVLTESCGVDGTELCELLDKWLRDDDVPVRPVLLLTFTSLASLTQRSLSTSLLDRLLQAKPETLIEEAIKVCLTSKQHNTIMLDWLRDDNIRSLLVRFVDDIEDGKDSERSMRLLKLAVSASTPLSGYVVSGLTVANILDKLSEKLLSERSCDARSNTALLLEHTFNEDNCVLYREHNPSIVGLVKSLLYTCLSSAEHRHRYMSLISKVLSSCWSSVRPTTSDVKRFILDFAPLVSDTFHNRSDKSGDGGLHNVVDVAFSLLSLLTSKCRDGDEQQLLVELSKDFLSNILTISKDKWEGAIEEVCLTALCVGGQTDLDDVVYARPNDTEKASWHPLRGVHLASYSLNVLFSTRLALRLAGHHDDTCSDEGLYSDALFIKSGVDELDALIMNYVYSLTLLTTAYKYYSSSEECFYSKDATTYLSNSLKELVQMLTPHHLLPKLSSHASTCGLKCSLWNLAQHTIRYDFMELSDGGESDASGEAGGERILTSELEQNSLRALRNKMESGIKSLDSYISFVCWKLDTSNQTTSLYNVCLTKVSRSDLCLSTEIGRLLSRLIQYNAGVIETKTWDLVVNCLAGWTKSLDITPDPPSSLEYVSFVKAVADLLISFHCYLYGNESADDPTRQERNKYILKAWSLFEHDVYSSIFTCWKHFAQVCSQVGGDAKALLMIESLSSAVCEIVKHKEGRLKPPNTQELLCLTRACCTLLLSSCPSVQITSYLTLLSFAGDLAALDCGLDENNSDKMSCLLLSDTLIKAHTVVEAMLQHFDLGVMCLVSAMTDSYTYSRAYLFTWLLLLEMFKSADSTTRHLYTVWLKQDRILDKLLDSLLLLLPSMLAFPSDTNAKKFQQIFSSNAAFSYDEWSSGRLSEVSCRVYIQVLRVVPLLSRLWYSETDPKTRDFVDKLTSPYVSPLLINEEINYALSQTNNCENLSLETLGGARLVNAVFTVEECKTLLVIQLASNHPLSPPKVDISKCVVSSSQAKQKLKQLTLLPTLQNGSLWDCIIVWKNYLDKKFEGVEECYICYSVLHHTSNQLPKLTCSTCKKKFHSACLYKWFTSSNKSTCPICRNLF